jgi:hypothetical protein
MDKSYFYEANKTSLPFSNFSIFFLNLQNLYFYRKMKNERKKGLFGLGPSHNEAGPT